jgi:Protein of unknown function (DUF1403)
VIRADLTLVPDPIADLGEAVPAPGLRHARPARKSADALLRQPFPSLPPAPVPAWARASGRAGQGDPLFFAGAGLSLLDSFLRAEPPVAGALRARLGLQSAAASAKILRLNADEVRLRDLRFPVGDRSRPRRTFYGSGATASAGRPASTQRGFLKQRRGWTSLSRTRRASRPV